MGDANPTTSSTRSVREIPVPKPRWAFWKGLLTGSVVEIPAIALAVWVAAHFGFGNPDTSFMRILRMTTVFAGLAALLTAGGVGRLAAYVTVERGRRRALFAAARAHALGGAALTLIAAIPHGALPMDWATWLVPLACGAVIGGLCGLLIGSVCSTSSAVGLSDVWSIARKPGETLKQLLDPEDFVRLGSALRNRTSTLFDGIFDPAPPPPGPKDGKDAPPAPPPAERTNDKT